MRLPSPTTGLKLISGTLQTKQTNRMTPVSTTDSDEQDAPWVERRTRKRFALVLPVVFHWRDGMDHSAVGYCRNVGLGGIFIVTGDCPPVGVEIKIEVVVPAFDPAPKEILFRHTGRVTRIQACKDLLGFAVVGKFEDEDAIQAHVANK